jgi:hypothetical protein
VIRSFIISKNKFSLALNSPGARQLCGVLLVTVFSAGVFTAAGCGSKSTKNQTDQNGAARAATDSQPAPADLYPGWETKEPLEISRAAFDASQEVFVPHDSYLSLSTPYAPVVHLIEQLQEREKLKLKNRGESHVTVVSPPEYTSLHKSGVGMAAVERTADALQLGESDLDPVCLGMGQAMINGKLERTYFIVLHSENILKIRHELARQELHSSSNDGFESEHFYPHITVGFTLDDLYEQQGVIKDQRSCLYRLRLLP